jgi:hypothetical protein
MLSEKAKGKQKAIEPLDDLHGSGDSTRSKPLVIRFTEGIEDLHLEVHEKDAIRDVKSKVRTSFKVYRWTNGFIRYVKLGLLSRIVDSA